jgi:hypothetical protein
MQPQELWSVYASHSEQASASARKLAFTGIGLVWIFSGGGVLQNGDEVTIRGIYLWPLALLVLSLAADFIQYLYLSLAWRILARHREFAIYRGEGSVEDDYQPHRAINLAGEVMFAVKLILVSVGTTWLLVSLSQHLLP